MTKTAARKLDQSILLPLRLGPPGGHNVVKRRQAKRRYGNGEGKGKGGRGFGGGGEGKG